MDLSLIYTALSRATSLNGLFLIGELKATGKPAEKPTKIMAELRKYSLFIPKFSFLRCVPSNMLQIVSFNVQSLRKHVRTVCNDKIFTESDMLILQETWALSNEEYAIPGMKEIIRNQLCGRPVAKGTIIFSKLQENITEQQSLQFERGNQHIELTVCKIFDLFVVNIYKGPASSIEFLENCLNQIRNTLQQDNVIIAGDYNENLLQLDSGIVKMMEKTYGLNLLSPKTPTTNGNTTIDGIFGTLADYKIEIHVYESYCSYHKPLVLRLQEKETVLTGLSENVMNIQI